MICFISRTFLPCKNQGLVLARFPTTPVSRPRTLPTVRRIQHNAANSPTHHHHQQQQVKSSLWNRIYARPIEYASIPCVAAFVAISTNWIAVKMLFYPIDYVGVEWRRAVDTPYGMFGWQGVVPTKTVMMAERLVKIITERLLSLDEAFGRLDATVLSRLLLPAVEESIRKDCGEVWFQVLSPILPMLLTHLLQQYLVGRVELEFLVNSGFGIGFLLGLSQMVAWAYIPAAWTLPAAGAVVGYVTSWIAIKLLFEPAEPITVANLFVVQGLFESRQVEVSDEFAAFMETRVLNSTTLLSNLSAGGKDGDLYAFLRRHLPYPIPSHIVETAVAAIAKVAANPIIYPDVHTYVTDTLDIDKTLSSRLKILSPTDFEDLLHPVFQEDESILIATGGVLGFLAGGLQTRLGWGGPGATIKAAVTIVGTLAASFALYAHQKYEEEMDEPLASIERPHLRRRETIVRPNVEI